MSFSPAADPSRSPAHGTLRRLLLPLASLKLAVVLIVVLAGILIVATFIEGAKGREFIMWHVYHSRWFTGLLGLLAVNILAATLVRFPWGWNRLGFLAAHIGLLVLLAGAIQSFVWGIEGHVTLAEGEAADSISMSERSQFTVVRDQATGVHGRMPLAFTFSPGPNDWPEGKTLDLGSFSGIGMKVLKFYRNAETHEKWVPEQSGQGCPAVQFALVGPDGMAGDEHWLAAEQFGARLAIGPTIFGLYLAPTATMAEDFLKPPAEMADKQGVLSMHYEGRMERVPVSANVGKKVPLGDGKVSVEIVECLPDSRPAGGGRFASRSDQPRNPMLELLIHQEGVSSPMRQIAFAKQPFLNLDGVHGRNTPVKFWYHHPEVKAPDCVEFLHTPEGKLFCRVGRDGKYDGQGEASKGKAVPFSPQFKLTLADYVPSARREVTCSPVRLGPGESAGPEAAALLELTVGDTTEQMWLLRNDSGYGRQLLSTPKGPVTVSFTNERLPLGFSLKLLDFRRDMNPGRMGIASYASTVRLIDPAAKVDAEHEISMNQPLMHGRYRFYQSSYQELGDGSEASVLSVAYDPGRLLKYLGSLLICAGSSLMCFRRIAQVRATPNATGEPRLTVERTPSANGKSTADESTLEVSQTA